MHVDFDVPCISSHGGGLALCDMRGSLAAKIGQAFPDTREKAFIRHPYEEMVCQRVGQIICGYEDANDCDSLRRVTEYLHAVWPHTIIMLWGDSHFCSHDFMEWVHRRHYVEFLTGLPGNATLLERVDKQRRMARNSYNKHKVPVCRYYSFYYKAQSCKYSQRVIAKVEYNGKGERTYAS